MQRLEVNEGIALFGSNNHDLGIGGATMSRHFRILLAAFLTAILLITVPVSAAWFGLDYSAPEAGVREGHVCALPSEAMNDIKINDYYDGSDIDRGLGLPTMYWNLYSSNYSGRFQDVSRTGIYTNYYFSPSNGRLQIDISVPTSNSADHYYVDLFRTNGTLLYSNQLTKGTARSVWYTTLDDNLFYCFKIRASTYGTISGTFTVHH